MTVTLRLEVFRPSVDLNFYNPSPDTCRAFPHTIEGVKKALRRMEKVAQDLDGVLDYRIAAYEGKKEAYNEKPLIGYMDPDQIRAAYSA